MLAAQIQNLNPIGPVPTPTPVKPPFVGGGGGTTGDNFDEVLEDARIHALVATADISAFVETAPITGGVKTASMVPSTETAVIRAKVKTE